MYFNDQTIAFLDGRWIKAKDATTGLYAQTLHYGNGVFEGIRAYDTPEGPHIFEADAHFKRLRYSADKMHILRRRYSGHVKSQGFTGRNNRQ